MLIPLILSFVFGNLTSSTLCDKPTSNLKYREIALQVNEIWRFSAYASRSFSNEPPFHEFPVLYGVIRKTLNVFDDIQEFRCESARVLESWSDKSDESFAKSTTTHSPPNKTNLLFQTLNILDLYFDWTDHEVSALAQTRKAGQCIVLQTSTSFHEFPYVIWGS